jgi:BlaI family penicillinase repressor
VSPDRHLTTLQLAVMRTLWKRGEARVNEVHGDLAETNGLAPTTVATLLKRLEARGLVEHRSEGRQFVYRPLISENEARRSMVSELGERLFEGDLTRLVSHLLQEHELRPGDLERVRRLIEEHEHAKERE